MHLKADFVHGIISMKDNFKSREQTIWHQEENTMQNPSYLRDHKFK